MKEYAPLLAIKNLKKKYPKAFRYADMIHRDMCEWDPSYCYINISAALSCISEGQEIKFDQHTDAQLLASLSTWRRSKNIYSFDLPLIEDLTQDPKDTVIPIEILCRMPYSAIYIETSNWKKEFDGFLVYWEDDHTTHEKELRFLFLSDEGKPLNECFIHIIPDGTIHDGIEKGKQLIVDNIRRQLASVSFSELNHALKAIDDNYLMICQAMQLVLYVCADNSSILEDPQQAELYHPGSTISDKFREIRKWNVEKGSKVQVHADEKKISADHEDKEKSTGSHSPKRPHVRRSHWHYFWKGRGNQRHLVLYWLDESYIHGDDQEQVQVKVIKKSKSILN